MLIALIADILLVVELVNNPKTEYTAWDLIPGLLDPGALMTKLSLLYVSKTKDPIVLASCWAPLIGGETLFGFGGVVAGECRS